MAKMFIYLLSRGAAVVGSGTYPPYSRVALEGAAILGGWGLRCSGELGFGELEKKEKELNSPGRKKTLPRVSFRVKKILFAS